MRILVASRNVKKLAELDRLLRGPDGTGTDGVELVSLADVTQYDEVPESGATFQENALIKAREGTQQTGLACVADDSGLMVDALNGMPGVLSARWSGQHGDDAANNALLLGQLTDVPDEQRGAAFASACALVTPAGEEMVVEGRWPGVIARKPLGKNGFGYDPIFIPQGDTRSAAQLSPEEKARISHRARALAELLPVLRRLASTGGIAP